MPGKWISTPIGPVYVPDGWRIWISNNRIRAIRGRDPRSVVTNIVRVSPPRDPSFLKRKKKRRRRKGLGSTCVKNIFSRYRESDLASDLFLNKKGLGQQITNSTKLGVLRRYVNFEKQSGLGGDYTAGGTLNPSLHRKRTWDQKHPGPPYVCGGPFKSVEYFLPASQVMAVGRYTSEGKPGNPPGTFDEYIGGFVDNGVWFGDSYSQIASKGFNNFPITSQYDTSAWDKLKPQLPKAGLGQFIYELRDLPRMLQTSANGFRHEWLNIGGDRLGFSDTPTVHIPFMRPRTAADHFLNNEFGWKPFLSDIAKLYDAWNHSVEYIAAIVRDNGQWVRRRRVLDQSDEVSVPAQIGSDSATIPSSSLRGPTGSAMTKSLPSPFGNNLGYAFQQNRTRKRVWAVGSFKYFRPEFDIALLNDDSFQMWASVQRLLTLYGANITPTLLYKITPWTWLIDWFTNLGDHIQRLDDFVQDGITSRYLYVMDTEEQWQTKTCVLNFFSGSVSVNFQRRLVTKQRRAADSPYGFNAPWNNLSLRQFAILGAIGISQSNGGFISRGA